jgi:hypothetical protein
LSATPLTCSHCAALLPEEQANVGWFDCPGCAKPTRIEIFPAYRRERPVGRAAEHIVADGEATCFAHPDKKAVAPCDSCGRFMCALCDLDIHGRHLCPQCMQVGRKKGKVQSLENRRTLYDRLALMLAVLPIITVYFTLLTAPTALFIGFRYWNAPGSLVGRRRWRMVLAMVIAALQIVGWVALVGVLIYALMQES